MKPDDLKVPPGQSRQAVLRAKHGVQTNERDRIRIAEGKAALRGPREHNPLEQWRNE